MTQNANTFLQVRDLVVEYTSDGKVIHAVNGVNFDLERGKALALVGETGAGKTTIAKSIMRILPDPPAHVRSGQVVLQGRDLMKLNEADMRKVRGKEISMIFQDPMTALNPTMRIGDQIAEVIRLHDKVTKAESMQKAQKMLETVGITAERYGNYPHQFSGLACQRISAPVLRRHEAARGHRHGTGQQPAAPDCGRTDLRTGRDDSGTGHGDDSGLD